MKKATKLTWSPERLGETNMGSIKIDFLWGEIPRFMNGITDDILKKNEVLIRIKIKSIDANIESWTCLIARAINLFPRCLPGVLREALKQYMIMFHRKYPDYIKTRKVH